MLDAQPSAPDTGDGARSEAALLHGFADSLGLAPDALSGSLQDLRELDDDAQLGYVLERARSAGLVTPDAGIARLRRQLRVFTSNLRALDAYVLRPYAGRLVAIEAGTPPAADRDTGWEELARGGVVRHTVAGDHYRMLRRPNVRVVAAQLETPLDALEPVAS